MDEQPPPAMPWLTAADNAVSPALIAVANEAVETTNDGMSCNTASHAIKPRLEECTQ